MTIFVPPVSHQLFVSTFVADSEAVEKRRRDSYPSSRKVPIFIKGALLSGPRKKAVRLIVVSGVSVTAGLHSSLK